MQRYVYWYRFEDMGDETYLRFAKFPRLHSTLSTEVFKAMGKEERQAHISDAILIELQTMIAAKAEIPPGDEGVRPLGDGLVSLPILQCVKLELYKIYLAEFRSIAELARHLSLRETSVRRMLDLSHRSAVSELEEAIEALGRRLVTSWDSELIGPNRHTAKTRRVEVSA